MQAITKGKSGGVALTIAEPTISDVLSQYLADEQKRLSADSFGRYAAVIDLLQDSLNGYAYQWLDEDETALFEDRYSAEGDEYREFCETFGPDKILPNAGEFLNYFMVRKVICGPELIRASGTVIKKLAKWLADKSYVSAADAQEAIALGACAVRDLPRADKLSSMLYELTCRDYRPDAEDGYPDHYQIMRVEPGKLWLQGLGSDKMLGPFRLPVEATALCEAGWSLVGVVKKRGRSYELLEACQVYT